MSKPTEAEQVSVCDAIDEHGCVLNALLQATDQMLVYLDSAFNFVWVNNAYAEGCGRKTEDLVGKNHFALYPHPENERIFQQVRDTGEAIFFKDKPFDFPDQPERGTTYWDWKLTPIKDGTGKVSGLVFSLRETTKQVLAESALRESEIRFRTLFDEAPVAIFVHDPENGALVQANRRAMESYGYSKLEELQQADLFGDPVFSEQKALKLIRQTLDAGPQRFEWRSIDRHGNAFWEDMLLTQVRFDGAPRVLAMATDISERKQAETALREADQRKDEFLAMLAHELRNPLTPIGNAAHVLGRYSHLDPQIKWAHEVIGGQVSHLGRLVDDLLDVSRIVRGKIALQRETLPLDALFGKLMSLAQPLTEKKGQELVVRLPEETILLDGDPVRLLQVLFNLVDNATKFTPKGGRIEISAHLEKGEAVIRVQDNGLGIAPDLLPRVFDLFQQDERSVDRTSGGLGIGLTLVKHIVTMHDGRVTAWSAGQGQGAEITVRLPALAVSTHPPSGMETAGAAHKPDSRLRVLVVDDDLAVADSMARVLALEGYDIRIAYTGQSALDQTPGFLPHVVLLDIGLKGMDGFETARRLRKMPGGQDLCLAAVTGYGDYKTREQATAAGFDHFMVKPVKFSLIRDLLTREAESRLGATPNP